MPTQMLEPEEMVATEKPESQLASNPLAVSSSQGAPAEDAGGGKGAHLRLAETAKSETGAVPETQVFQRGAYTFNRRFFETRFAAFFGMIRRDTDKDLVLLIKSGRGHYIAHRITRITAADVHFQVHGGEEVMVPFTEIQEVHLKHKEA
jgi:hypothetical protein